MYTQPPLLAGPNPGNAVACWIPGAPSKQARNRPPLGQRVVFPSTSGLRKLPAASLSDASAGEVPYLIGEQPALGYPACPGTGHQRSGGRVRSSPPHPPRGPHLHPAILALSPAPSEEDRVPREMSRWPAASSPVLRSSSVLREPCVSGGVGW